MKIRFFLSIKFFIVFLSIASCSFIRIPTSHDYNFRIEHIPDPKVILYQPMVLNDKDKVVITGIVKGMQFRSRLNGHIDLAILNYDNDIISFQSVKLFRKFPFNNSYRYGYRADIQASSLDEKVTVRIAYHRPPIMSDTFNCGENKAITFE